MADTSVNVVRIGKLLSMYYCDVLDMWKARSITEDYLSDICNSKSKRKSKIEINESLPLTTFNYMNNNDVHRKEDNCIKEELFEFLSSVNRSF